MIRVLHCVNGMNRGGLETFIMNVYRNIDRTKVQFDFLVHTDQKCDFDDEIHDFGGKIFKIYPRSNGFVENYKSLDTFFRTHPEYKIFHQHSSSLSYIEPLRAAKRYQLPIRIIHSHSTKEGGKSIHNFIHKWNRIFIKSYATHYFACSDYAGEWLYANKDFTVINNGIKTSEFVFNEEVRQKVRCKLGVESKFVIGHIGRFSYPKNHEYLIEIFNAVYQKDSNVVLLLVGDGELRESIELKIKRLGLEKNVILTGMRDDIPDLLQAMDIFVFPSHYEGLPVSLVEAQSIGLPCLVSENITKQVKITDNISYVNISDSLTTWVDQVLEVRDNFIRRDESKKVIDAGFDIEEIGQNLQKLYLNY